MLIILIVLLVIGYAARALDGGSEARTQPAWEWTQPAREWTQPAREWTQPAREWTQPAREWTQPAQDGGRLAAKAAMPSCACGPAK